VIERQNGSKQHFFEFDLLKPYIGGQLEGPVDFPQWTAWPLRKLI
jgi:hypothetical protein